LPGKREDPSVVKVLKYSYKKVPGRLIIFLMSFSPNMENNFQLPEADTY
jgi:hypothetical protein